MKILVFDNYDSFTYNLVHLIEKITGVLPDVYRNDEIALEKIGEYDKIVLSPGPGIPSEAGSLLDVIRTYGGKKDMLGVCLGQQAIAEALGGNIVNLESVFHGVATAMKVEKDGGYLFRNIPSTFKAGRYHSWVVDEKTLPGSLRITARDEEGNIMALEHSSGKLAAVQFHPESIMTEHGETLMRNFIEH